MGSTKSSWRKRCSGRQERKTEDKIRLFRSFFSGLPNVYGTYDPVSGRARQVKAQVTNKVLPAHLTGRQPYGVYLLAKDKTRAIAVDFDTKDLLPPTEFLGMAKHYGLSAYLEQSKSKGFHAWIFFLEQGVIARKARMVVQHILERNRATSNRNLPQTRRDRHQYALWQFH